MAPDSYYKYYFDSDEIEGSAERIRAMNELVYDYLSPHLQPGSPVLELGTGKGFFAWICSEHGHPYQGVEANEEQCSRLREQGLEITCASVPPLPAAKQRYGLIYSAHLLEHLPDSHAVHQLLSECASGLEEDGVVAMLFPDAESMKADFWNCDYTHTYATTGRRVSQAMADSGLRVVASHTLNGHYMGAKRLLARAGSLRLVKSAAGALARGPEKRDLYYRGWLYLQKTVLLVARAGGAR